MPYAPSAPIATDEFHAQEKNSKPFARRTYLMRDGRKLKVVLNNTNQTYELLLNKRSLTESSSFLEVDNLFKKMVRKDKGFPV